MFVFIVEDDVLEFVWKKLKRGFFCGMCGKEIRLRVEVKNIMSIKRVCEEREVFFESEGLEEVFLKWFRREDDELKFDKGEVVKVILLGVVYYK